MVKLFVRFVPLLLLMARNTLGQSVDSTLSARLPLSDSLPAVTARIIAPVKKTFPVSMLIIPATLITYGITSMENDGLKSINEGIREEIWDDKPHRQIQIDNYLQWAPAVAVYGLNALGIKGEHNFRDRTIIYGLSTAIMASTVYATKSMSKQWRPDESDRSSFPSGHTATAFAAAEFLRKEYWKVSPWYGIAGYAAAATTGYLRMYNNKHWFSDVVAGAGIGILSTDLAYCLYPTVKRIFVKDKKTATVVAPFYQQGAIGLCMVRRF
ncbi:phosphatase PAP2 family protein [Paraflavitalea speifideaquila]|uniref:phosphatase PAP2 family protein n=1 Tax=Paraflavitalea speifideaquila TaxID=3076558 RepID=UPI0028F06C98|nr:phosphatase PAP2 family protein [Paraflavitalea speifideiaquila]